MDGWMAASTSEEERSQEKERDTRRSINQDKSVLGIANMLLMEEEVDGVDCG